MKVLDPVCGMRFDVEEAAGESLYEDQPYYFCGVGCKRAFDEDPERYVVTAEEASQESARE